MNQSPMFRNKLIASNAYFAPEDAFDDDSLKKVYKSLDRFDKPAIDRQIKALGKDIPRMGLVNSLQVLACLVREGFWYPEKDGG